MNNFVLYLCLLIMVSVGCHSKKSKVVNKTSISDTAKFFPLTPFLKEQIAFVDLQDFVIKKINSVKGQTDSGTITKNQFIAIANLFLPPISSFEKNKFLFKENVFRDLSTGSYTLNYTPNDVSAMEIQNIDILLDEETNYPKRVFIKKIMIKGDTSITEQFNWKTNKSLQITRYCTVGSQYAETEVTTVRWQNK